MRHSVFLEHIDEEEGERALDLALDALCSQLPEGAEVCGCAHKVSSLIRAHLQITIDGEPYSIGWSGSHLKKFAQFIEGNLVPILATWKRSLPEFFRNLAAYSSRVPRVCSPSLCPLANKMENRNEA